MREKNVSQKIENLNAKLGTWRSRQLSIFGRCLIVKSLGISQIVHSAAMLDIHKDCSVKIQSSIFKFIWKEKQDKIIREVLYQDYERGGLRVTHVETLCKALHLAWIRRFLRSDSRGMESEKVIPCSFFKKYGGLNFLLCCNFDEKFLKSIEMPSFYKQILSFFLELKSSYDTNGDQELILFNNKEKQIGGKTVFILYILRFSHEILLCEKAFWILLRPIREAKRVSHTCKNRFVQSQTTV